MARETNLVYVVILESDLIYFVNMIHN